MFEWISKNKYIILICIIGLIIWFIFKHYIVPKEKLKEEIKQDEIDYTDTNAVLSRLEEEHIQEENNKIQQELAEANNRKWNDEGLVKIEIECGNISCSFIIQLLFKEAPYASLNFIALSGLHPTIHPRYTYINTQIHKWIKDMCIQMGDVLNREGRTIYSIYDRPYQHEGSKILNQEGLVAMISDGPDRNGCQFMIMTQPTPWLNGQYTVFGVIVEGFTNLIRFGENIDIDKNGTPNIPIYIKDISLYKEL